MLKLIPLKFIHIYLICSNSRKTKKNNQQTQLSKTYRFNLFKIMKKKEILTTIFQKLFSLSEIEKIISDC